MITECTATGCLVSTEEGTVAGYLPPMPTRTREMPPIWVRLCELVHLDPASASVDRVHDAVGHVVGRGTIQRIFEGEQRPRLSSLETIAEQLRVPVASLVSERPQPAPPPRPPRDFADRREVTESEWALLQAVKVTMTDAERQELLRRHELLIEQATQQMRKVAPT